ncbi:MULTISPECIES: cobyrinate a,c-diamide synthase [unclassified Methylibium]|uniref:cobyrinate a,c-diamide synthase n=1 Tax=unclassified Methylibium TaxID=2633235 RepID=UPI0005655B38|nr:MULTISPECIES: cobyrinate a,c-diamide synthase [unclassified Methylibium]
MAAASPALLIGAPASGQGKTTATAALARWHRSQGRRVRVFKTGPDFLDPMVLERASGAPVYQLDLWMGGEAHCRELLYRAACEADVILVEGVMGLHDGTPSSADLALRFGLPVLAVIDGAAMAQTFGALALGLARYRDGLQLAGVLANRVGSEGHQRMLQESLPAGMAWYGALPRDEAMALPSRHLGLVQAGEVDDIEQRIERAAQALGAAQPPLPPVVHFDAPAEEAAAGLLLAGVSVAVARDAAFSFAYRANLDTLRALGAELLFFSPLADEPVPQVAHSVYLPGGYPELHLEPLVANAATRASIQRHHAQGRPIVAECGGMLALLESLTDAQGHAAPMWGLLPGRGVLQKRLANLGLQSAELPEGTLRGHTFHHALIETPLVPLAMTQAQRQHGRAEALYRAGRLHASFLHLYFPSNPAAVAALFRP